ncbi:MAG TPA: hypothetical protein VGP06_11820, partial [Janthinobacterium sp.]|nr:hypothetical protein [Janthinobacterium sp.]
MIASVLALLGGVVSFALYARRRRWSDAALALLAALALAGWQNGIPLPGRPAAGLTVVTDGAAAAPAASGRVIDARVQASPGGAAALREAWTRAASVTLLGDGLDDAQLRDLPARPLRWQAPAAPLLWLDFPRELALGRLFTLTLRGPADQAKSWTGRRLQLLAENRQVIAESAAVPAGGAASLSLQWLPPVAETMLLQARLLDGAGKTVASGPLPLRVTAAAPLQLQERLDAPSFDGRALERLLADGGAIVDAQVTLGKALTRSQRARAPLAAPNAVIADAAYIEHLPGAARSALLARVGAGLPLLVLAGNAADSGVWVRETGLRLHFPGKDETRALGTLALTAAPSPDAGDGAWRVLAADSRQQPWLWQRDWQQGRIVWLGVADWHRYAIAAPQALGLWWQEVLDRAAAGAAAKLLWQFGDAMPQAGLRSEICGQGAAPGTPLQAEGMAPASWLARADQADAAC